MSSNRLLLVTQKKRVANMLEDDAKRLAFVKEHLKKSDADANEVLDEDEARVAA